MPVYVHHSQKGPDFTWDQANIVLLLAEVRFRQGRLLGRMAGMGSNFQEEVYSAVRAADLQVSGAGDGRFFSGLLPDVVREYALPVTKDRMVGWHSVLFPGFTATTHGLKRNVHFQVSITDGEDGKLIRLIHWANSTGDIDPVIKAALTYLWLMVIQPFSQGSERVAALVTEVLLARANQVGERVYSVSRQIISEREECQAVLKKLGKSPGDVTLWIVTFLGCLGRAIARSEEMLERILEKEKFWERVTRMALNERQRMMLEKLQEGGEEKLTSSRWAALTKTSQDTAGRDINDLVRRGVMVRDAGGGRSTGYVINGPING